MNALEEFMEHTEGLEILCARITKGYAFSFDDVDEDAIILPVDYQHEDLVAFLKSLDFNYDNGYGIQYLYGTIWYKDGTWSSRVEYDGSEWWEYNACPMIPNDCRK
jgi:hypothetical protein